MNSFNPLLSLYIPRIDILPDGTFSENPSAEIKKKLWKLGKIDHVDCVVQFDELGKKYYSAFIYFIEWDYYQDNIILQENIRIYGCGIHYYTSSQFWKLFKNDVFKNNTMDYSQECKAVLAPNDVVPIGTCLPVTEMSTYIESLRKTITQQKEYIEQLEYNNAKLGQKITMLHLATLPETRNLANTAM